MEKYNSIPETQRHILSVQEKIEYFIKDLKHRAEIHDKSKMVSPELEIFDEYTPKLKGTTYGSDEYKEHLEGMKVGLKHHYANNRHHPEYHKDGINDMTLIDLIEMFSDWWAATERHADGDMDKSIEVNAKRFEISEQLTKIFKNTLDEIYKNIETNK